MKSMQSSVMLGLAASLLVSDVAWARGPAARPPDSKAPHRQPGTLLEDVPEPLVPKRPRTQAEQDRLESLALFAAGRMKEQQQDYPGALRLYQRALRYDPTALPVLEQIVPLAFSLNRSQEAVRYALKAVELNPSDALLLRRLGVHLSEQGDFQGAIKLHERALALEDKSQQKTPAHIVLVLEMGRLYYITKAYKQAADAFAEVEKALEHPDDFGINAKLRKDLLSEPAKLHELFGNAYLESGQFARATAAFEQAQQSGQDKSVLKFNLARAAAAAGEPAKGLGHLQVYLDAGAASQGAAAYDLLAELLKKSGKSDELMRRLEQSREQDQGNVPLAYYLAERYRQAGRFEQAEPIYSKLHKQTPTPESFSGLAHIYRKRQQAEPLLTLLGQCVADGGDLDALGDEADEITQDAALVKSLLAAARKQTRSSEKSDKPDHSLPLAAALLAIDTKQFDAAAEFFDLAVKAAPKEAAEMLLMWGLGLLSDERYAQAVAVFQRGIDERVVPADNPAFHFYLAGALELDGKTEAAITAAKKAISISPDAPRLHSRLPWILFHAKRYDEAVKGYTELVEKFNSVYGSTEVRQVLREARLVLSNICVLQKNIPQAEEWLEQVLDEFPEDISALNDLGYLWADQAKNLPRALEMTKKAVAAEPENAAYRDSLGWTLFKLGRYDEALAELKLAAKGEKPDGVILDHLGDCYQKLNRTESAAEAWRRAVETFDPHEHAAELKATQAKLRR